MEIILSVIFGLFAAVLFRGAWLMIGDANERYGQRKKEGKE